MGVLLFAKKKNSSRWPDLDKLAARAKQAYDSLLSDVSFDLYYHFDASINNTEHILETELTTK